MKRQEVVILVLSLALVGMVFYLAACYQPASAKARMKAPIKLRVVK